MAQTPEQSEHTSIKARIHELNKNPERTGADNTPSDLLPFAGNPRQDMLKGLPFSLEDYLEMVDWTGRAILENKRGYIPENQPPILDRLQIEPRHWLYMTQHFESRFKGLVGASYTLKAVCRKLEYQRTPNLGAVLALLT
jgi:hypothetical protein